MSKEHDLVDQLIKDWGREQPDLDVTAIGIVGRIMHLSELYETQANKALKKFKLKYTDFDLLATLRRSGEPYKLNPTELRQSVLISSGAMTACLDRLERAGFLSREPDPEDRRGTKVKLTPKGKTLVDKAAPERFKIAQEELSVLTKTEISRLTSLLRKLSIA